MKIKKKRLVTGIKPTGDLTLGNYLGVIKPLVSFQKKFFKKYDFFLFIADLHALTTFQEPSLFKKRIHDIACLYLASGLNIENINLFIQSEIPQHTYLNYILESTSYLGELKRMIQFKEKKKNNCFRNIRTSVLTYPILMAADILLYDANIVPVGQDQKQHLELTRILAKRFNSLYGDIFVVPNFVKSGEIIKSLVEPSKKMSKSIQKKLFNDDKGCIFILEKLENIKNKILKAVTDNENEIKYDLEKKPGISNLLTIYSSLKEWNIEKTEKYFKGFSYKNFKEEVVQLVIEEISVLQKRFFYFQNNFFVSEFLNKSVQKIRIIAEKKIKQIKEKMGLMRIF